MTKLLLRIFTICILCQNGIGAITIEEKKAGISSSTIDGELTPKLKTLLEHTNADVETSKSELNILYNTIATMQQECAPEEDYEPLLMRINTIRHRIRNVQNQWRKEASSEDHGDNYSLWHQPETTIGQLVDDYASEDYIYISNPEISKIKISVDSNLPIPRSSWEEILELILNQNGVGIRQINPFLRELYLFQNDNAGLRLLTSKREDLEFVPLDERVAFVLTPDSTELKRIWFFLNRFVSPATTTLQLVGREILIIARNSDVQELLKVYDFVCHNKGNIEYKAVKVTKVNVEEMAKTLAAIFDAITDGTKDIGIGGNGPLGGAFPQQPGQSGQRNMPPPMAPRRQEPAGPMAPKSGLSGGQQVYGNNSLKIFALREIGQALVLVGTKEEIYRAEEIIRKVEEQVGDPHQKVIFWYTVKHSDPEELAQVLARIYDLMITTGTFGQMNPQIRDRLAQDGPPLSAEELRVQRDLNAERFRGPPSPFPSPIGPREVIGPSPQQGFFLNESNYLIDPDDRHIPRPDPNFGRNNFIVDLKTSALVMVVEADLLQDIKDLIKRLDVPKKMVQIEIMLVEQVLTHNDNVGLNLLNIGCLASNKDVTSFAFNALSSPLQGITDFIVSRPQTKNIPAYDIAYQFLISRDDVRINASPSVLTVNQTPATIEIEKEISVSTGTFLVPNGSSTTTQQSFARARYGIKIDVTPTVHMSDSNLEGTFCDNLPNYITLDSDIKFETIVGDFLTNNQPPVIRRALKNQARVADGQTIIIGGFRRKDTADLSRAIPFLGEIPGFGKLFSSTRMSDEATEMFLFMTSKIVSNPEDELEKIKMEEMSRRAGDLPYFTRALQEAREQEQNELFQGTLRLLFGRNPDRTVDTEAMETRAYFGVCGYDGR